MISFNNADECEIIFFFFMNNMYIYLPVPDLTIDMCVQYITRSEDKWRVYNKHKLPALLISNFDLTGNPLSPQIHHHKVSKLSDILLIFTSKSSVLVHSVISPHRRSFTGCPTNSASKPSSPRRRTWRPRSRRRCGPILHRQRRRRL